MSLTFLGKICYETNDSNDPHHIINIFVIGVSKKIHKSTSPDYSNIGGRHRASSLPAYPHGLLISLPNLMSTNDNNYFHL